MSLQSSKTRMARAVQSLQLDTETSAIAALYLREAAQTEGARLFRARHTLSGLVDNGYNPTTRPTLITPVPTYLRPLTVCGLGIRHHGATVGRGVVHLRLASTCAGTRELLRLNGYRVADYW